MRLVWLLEKCEGRVYAEARPKTLALVAEVGAKLGAMDLALADLHIPPWRVISSGT